MSDLAGALYTLRPFIRALRREVRRAVSPGSMSPAGQAIPAERAIWYAKPVIIAT